MEDLNLIACLYPADGDLRAEAAIRMREKSAQYIPPLRDPKSVPGSRESTVDDGENDDGENDDHYLKTQPGLQLTFNPGPKAGQGFVIGTDENRCDVVLPRTGRISRRHCCLTFDAKRRLILRDLSTNGTIVEYDGQGGEKRRTIITYDDKGREKRHHFTWILSGGEASKVEKIIINIEDIKFQIIVAKHETYPDLYNDKVDRFLCEANADDELPFGALGIQSTTSTAQQSGAHTPTPQTPIYINQWRLGSGKFSIVNRVWDVSTGDVYASKEIFNMRESQWRREARIMDQVSRLSNEHIVRLVAFIETPSPRLILEYLPCGNLEDQHKYHRFSYQESLTILCQSLDALTSVHENDIVHRDIKPANILVLSRNPLYIKLGDFGLSKATANLRTFCGTSVYAAPEIYTTRRSEYYTKACDIWSLGVLVFSYAYNRLPKFHDEDEGLVWCKMIIEQVNDWDSDDLVDFLSTAMVIIKPDHRLPARECWEQALQLSAPSQSRCPTPTQASYSASCLQEVSDPYPAMPSATPTEVATFIARECLENRNPVQETNTAPWQATVNHYLIDYGTGEQELDDQESSGNLSNEGGSRARKIKRKKGSKTDSTPTPPERRSKSPTHSTRRSSTVRRSKRTRRKEHGQHLQYLSVDATDLFGSNWLQDPNCVGSSVADLGGDVDEGSEMSNWTPFPSQSLASTQASDVVHEQNNSHASSLVDTREVSAHEPDVERLRTGQPRNAGWTRLDTKSSSPEVHITPNDKAGSSGWYSSIPKDSDFEYVIGDNDAWHVSRTRWESDAQLAEQPFIQAGLLDPEYVDRVLERYMNPEQVYEHTSGSEDNASVNRSLSGPQVTSIRAQEDVDRSRHDLSPFPDLKSVALGVNPEPEIGNASSEWILLPHKASGLAEDSDSVPESTTLNHLATKDIAPIVEQVPPVLPRGFSAIEWNGCWVARRGGDINITQACSAVGLTKWYQRTRIVKTRGYYQDGTGYRGLYVPPDYAREVLGSAGADLMDKLCPAEEQPTQSVQRPHGEIVAAGSGPGDTGFDHNGPEREAADTCNIVAMKTRTHFSKAHRATLEAAYQRNPKPKKTEQAEIAKELGVEKDRIRMWFQNRRQKSKHTSDDDDAAGSGEGKAEVLRQPEEELKGAKAPLMRSSTA